MGFDGHANPCRYVKFDTFHPAVDRGLPVTRVISRVTLQQILAKAVIKHGGEDIIRGNSHVVGFEETLDPATGEELATAKAATACTTATLQWTCQAVVVCAKLRTCSLQQARPCGPNSLVSAICCAGDSCCQGYHFQQLLARLSEQKRSKTETG